MLTFRVLAEQLLFLGFYDTVLPFVFFLALFFGFLRKVGVGCSLSSILAFGASSLIIWHFYNDRISRFLAQPMAALGLLGIPLFLGFVGASIFYAKYQDII